MSASRAREPADWLSRALARAGILPLKEAEQAIAHGRVQVAGRVVRQPFTQVRPGAEVRVDGRRVTLAAPVHVLAFHKPPGLVTSRVDPHGEGTVFDALLPQLPPPLRAFQWHAAGRLDRDTTGLLLFTNDEKVVAHLTSPDAKLLKLYRARVQGQPSEEQLAPLREGLVLGKERARPANIRVLRDQEVELGLYEGKFHQARRMLAAVGLPVRALCRVAIGQLALDLPEGAWRSLSAEEIRVALGFHLDTAAGNGGR